MSIIDNNQERKSQTNNKELRKLPSVEHFLISDGIQEAITRYSCTLVTQSLQTVLAENRGRILSGGICPSKPEILREITQHLYQQWSGLCSSVINGTGVILHTNIGRAPLSGKAIASLSETSKNYCNLEYDLPTGKRGIRARAVEKLLCAITGAESALVVNNNAGAVFLILATLSEGKEIILSRGELVQIGGGFRIPEIIEVAGVCLREVGTTNKTFIEDYERAIGEKTALLLKVHTSNFAIRGFTHSVSAEELRTLGEKYNLPVVYDIGSGALLDTADFGLEHETTVQEALTNGADIVCFSGDKLLGGPQSGIILGAKKYLDILRKHPLLRIVRIDKMSTIALEATLMHYLKKEAVTEIPIWRMISASIDGLRARAEAVIEELISAGVKSEIQEGRSMVGGGSLPDQTLPTILVVVKPPYSVEEFAFKLRLSSPAIIGRISENSFIIDMRTVLPTLDKTVIEVIKDAFIQTGQGKC